MSILVQGLSDSTSVDISSRLFFFLPSDNPYLWYLSTSTQRRSLDDYHRADFYSFLEDFINE